MSEAQLTALVHIVQLGNRFVTFQLRGLEFKGVCGRRRRGRGGANAAAYVGRERERLAGGFCMARRACGCLCVSLRSVRPSTSMSACACRRQCLSVFTMYVGGCVYVGVADRTVRVSA
jgi:hypothetical protein